MSLDRTVGRRRANSDRRAFRPVLEAGGAGGPGLESRLLLSHALPPGVFLRHTKPGYAFIHGQPPFRVGTSAHPFPIAHFPRGAQVATETAHGGQSVIVATPDGSHFTIQITQWIPTPGGTQNATTPSPNAQGAIQGAVPGSTAPAQPLGTVRAYPMPGGRVGIIVDGSTNQTELDISPYPQYQRKGYAHSFSYGNTTMTHVLNIGQITINSGVIAAINGYHTADLSGPLTVSGTNPVDRISLDAILPGASIQTGGDLNTLDVLNNVTLDSGPGITIGRDFNLFNAGGNVSLSNGASIKVGRFIGIVPQPAKGTGTGSNLLAVNQAIIGTGISTVVPALSGFIQGNFSVGSGSVFSAANGIAISSLSTNTLGSLVPTPSVFLIEGTLTTSSGTFSQIEIPGISSYNTGTTLSNLTPPIATPPNTNELVAKSGSNIAGFGP